MSDRPKCPLGDNCDMTLAYMAGHAEAKSRAEELQKMNASYRRIIESQARTITGLKEALEARDDE